MSALIRVLAIVALFPSLAFADQWVPYTDGRAGGCFIGSSGFMYGCTPQPPQVIEVPTRDPTQDRQIQQQQRENEQLRQRLQDQRNALQLEQQNQIDRNSKIIAQKTIDELRRQAELNSPEAQAQQKLRTCILDINCRCALEGKTVKLGALKRGVGANGEPTFEQINECQ